MNYALKCERCDRPAPVISKKHGRRKEGNETIKKTVAHQCEYGGMIKPVME